MIRNVTNLSRHAYDLLVIGGGIYGVCVAWDAALRGLSVALVEKGDFGHATSSNSLRVIHGGLRYLQQGDIRRLRRSIEERAAFMRIAPHLVHPLPILIPTYGHSLRGKEILSLAIFINKIVGLDRNYLPGAHNQLLEGRVVSKQECLRLFPGVCENGLTGGAIVYDCQMSNSERLVLSFARTAHKAGAELANYVECADLLTNDGRVLGIKARDVLTGDELTVSARVVVNASGPWIDRVLATLNGGRLRPPVPFSKAFNLLIDRQLVPEYAVGVYSQNTFKDRDAILNKGSRLFFIMPWHNRSLIGTAHLPFNGEPDNCEVTEAEIQSFIGEINDAFPTAALKLSDVQRAYSGLLPVVERGGVQLVRHHQLYDHEEDGVHGLISVSGVKFTEARYVAEKAIDAVFKKLGKKPPKSTTAVTSLHDGQIERFNDFLTEETQRRSGELSERTVRLLTSHYGSAYSDVLKYGPTATDASWLIRAEVLHAIREEMAQKLTDLVFRRTTLAIPGNLTKPALKKCVAVMANELGWNEERVQRELAEVRAVPAASGFVEPKRMSPPERAREPHDYGREI
jgi:glycerol-3-phosphate dehydrogenase